MTGHIEVEVDELPSEGGFGIRSPDIMVTSAYLATLTEDLESGLIKTEKYADFIQSYQMDLLQFFVVAVEEIEEKSRSRLVNKVISNEIQDDDDLNERALVSELGTKSFWDYAKHYELDVVVDSPGEKSINDVRELRNELVHDPDKFTDSPPDPDELVSYINSTIDLVQQLEE